MVFLLASAGGAARAQAPRHFGASAWLTRPVELPIGEAGRLCAVLPHRELLVEPPRATVCRVLRHVALGSAAGATWSYALYRHSSEFDAAGPVQPDTLVELELVLLTTASRSTDRLAAVAHAREDYTGVADISATLAGHPAGMLLSAEFCSNGTGGCWQEFLELRGSRWRELDDPYGLLLAELGRRGIVMEVRGSRLGMPRIDARTLRGTSGLWGSHDANCCPARRVDFQLGLTDQGFGLVALQVVANSP